MARSAVFFLLLAVFAAGCPRGADDANVATETRRRNVAPEGPRRPRSDAESVVYAPVHRIVRELDPPLPPAEPEECGVTDEFRPALGCLESLPLGDSVVPRPNDGRLMVDGALPRRLWNRPMLIEPRVRGEPLAGFKLAPAQVLEAGFFGFEFETRLPPLDGDEDLELQIRGYVVPPPTRDFFSAPIAIEAGDFLAFGLALNEVGVPFTTGPVQFSLAAIDDSGERELFAEELDATGWSGEWLDRRVDLSALQGRTIRLHFRTTATAPDGGTARAFPLWGSPEIFQATERGTRRNLILISLDTWRADHFGTDVSGGPVTPRLAELAHRGVMFAQAVTTYPSTSASHMSLFTGVYPVTHQVRFANDILGSPVPTLAEILAAHGYQTGAVTENAMLLAEAGFSFGFDSYFENKGLGLWSTEGQIDSTLARGRRWLDHHRGERFFLFLHTYQIHTPYEPPKELVLGPTEADLAAAAGREPAWVTRERHRYAGEVRYADMALAGFLEELDRSGVLDESIVVLTSDHGEEFAEHDRMGHSKSVYDEVLRVPLLVWAPGLAKPGLVVEEQVSLVDVAPTILDLLGIESPGALQGRSLRATLETGRPPTVGPHFAEGPDVSKPGKRLVAVRTGTHKWIAPEGSTTPTEMYDLRTDPAEQTNLEGEDLRAAGARHLATYHKLAGGPAQTRELDARTTEKLRALGYVE